MVEQMGKARNQNTMQIAPILLSHATLVAESCHASYIRKAPLWAIPLAMHIYVQRDLYTRKESYEDNTV